MNLISFVHILIEGNLISFFLTSATTADQKEIELSSLLSDMKEFCNKYPRNYKVEEWSSLYKLHMKESMERMNNPEDQIVYACSSWCRFPFYDADFGWGKPVWITTPIILSKNCDYIDGCQRWWGNWSICEFREGGNGRVWAKWGASFLLWTPKVKAIEHKLIFDCWFFIVFIFEGSFSIFNVMNERLVSFPLCFIVNYDIFSLYTCWCILLIHSTSAILWQSPQHTFLTNIF